MTDESLEALWDMGGANRPPRRKRSKQSTPRKDLESAVQRECLLWLRAQPNVVLIERRNTGAIQFEGGGMVRFGSRGRADIWCLCSVPRVIQQGGMFVGDPSATYAECEQPGTHIEIECKRRDGKGRLSYHQQKFKELCDKNGIPYLVVTSADDLEKQWKNLGFST